MFTKILHITTILLSFSFSGYSQADSTSEALRFYPLHIGDYWQYQATRRGGGFGNFPSDTDWVSYREILGETKMSNNKRYFIVKESDLNFQNRQTLIRIDTASGYLYRFSNHKESIVDSLLGINSFIQDCSIAISNIFIDYIFEEPIFTKEYSPSCINVNGDWWSYKLSENIGLVNKYELEVNVIGISYNYQLNYAKINGKEYGTLVNIPQSNETLPDVFYLSQNYPNPFNPSTHIKFGLPKESWISLIIYNILGEQVEQLVNQEHNAGFYNIKFNSSNYPPGVYFYTLQAGENIETKKMVLLK